jgi:hypothetical protein
MPNSGAGWPASSWVKNWQPKYMVGSSMDPDPIQVAAAVTTLLEKLDIPYFIGGSLASTLHGMVRTTQDVDIVAMLQAENIRPFSDALKNEFYVDEEMIAAAVSRRSSFNVIHRQSMFKVDVFIPPDRPFSNAQFSRARKETLSPDPQIEAIVATAEDTMLAKLDWYRQGGETSERQWRDVLGLLKVQRGALDLVYLRDAAAELKISDLLERALKEA